MQEFDKLCPANLLEVRPKEDFWSITKVKIYENKLEAKPMNQLEVKIKKCLQLFNDICLILLKIENKLLRSLRF